MSPDARQPERCWAVYRDGELVFAFLPEPGAIRPAVENASPVADGAFIRGRFFLTEAQRPILAMLADSSDQHTFRDRLANDGYELVETPVAAIPNFQS